ncbi:M15 family metallopeptidase [Actinoplanes sp. Pm04-4]|uniref:M15 family metallopeptidase n=1 Tax=Paractinoplanes pyxinae TaxID=2997416 RepID=A0ABT4BB34_9ACTN|nr:M15 family metallopeptidase [Actinoplanes pyxinae]MCY1143711.1 M15 family metallopeptidase [Actinoplanes pyxinae]
MRASFFVSIMSAVTSAVLGAVGVVAPAAAGDGYRASIKSIDVAEARAMMGVSWHRGCPVKISDLRRVKLTHWGFDGVRHQGVLIVHKEVARSVVDIFHTLYSMRFPVRTMLPVDHFGADDNASMAADNTSAFNCRPKTGSTSGFSVHSYGKAIDVNTLENPYVKGTVVQPPAGKAFTNRAYVRPGMIRHGDRVWRAFAMHGFAWGGDWTSLKDYQHFEAAI